MPDEQSNTDVIRQDTRAEGDGYVAGRDMTVVNQYGSIQESAQRGNQAEREQGIVGQLINSIVDPYDLEIHPSIAVSNSVSQPPDLTPYISRAHDHTLHQVITTALERSAVAVLVGGSSTGKTRACWEAIRALPREWRVWHPISPTRPEALWAALQEGSIAPHTVIWLNETQYYLDTSPSELGEKIAAGLRDLIRSSERGPVLVLGTLWPEYWDPLTQRPPVGAKDPHAQARDLLASRGITVPDRFEKHDLSNLTSDAVTDPRINEAMRRKDGRLTQFLAGAFEVLGRYELAPPEARAIIDAAIDMRRFGNEIISGFLQAATPGYLDDDTWNNLNDDWFENGLNYASRRSLGALGALTRVRPRPGGQDSLPVSYRLFDYLEEIGSSRRKYAVPPQTFWDAAADFARTTDELEDLAREAQSRARFHCAAKLYVRAAEKGDLEALLYLSHYRRIAKDSTAAKQLLRQAAERGVDDAWLSLADIEEEEGNAKLAEQLLESAESSRLVLEKRALLRYKAGDFDGYRSLLEQAASLGSWSAMRQLAGFLEKNGGPRERVNELRKKARESETDIFKELVRAARDIRRYGRERARAADNFVKVASESDNSLEEIYSLIESMSGAGSISDTVLLARIEMTRGFTERAKEHFAKALDGGSMDEKGRNVPLEMLAEIMRKAGNKELAGRMIKYGLEPDGSIAQPWTVIMEI